MECDVCAVGELGRLAHGVAHLAVDGAGVRALVGAVVADLGGERGGQSLAACFGWVFEEEVEDVGADGERAATLLERVSEAFGGGGDPVQVPGGASQRCEVGAEPGVGQAADELDLELGDEVGELGDGGELGELVLAERGVEVLGG